MAGVVNASPNTSRLSKITHIGRTFNDGGIKLIAVTGLERSMLGSATYSNTGALSAPCCVTLPVIESFKNDAMWAQRVLPKYIILGGPKESPLIRFTQGGRSCAKPRRAFAEKFRFGRKF